MKNSCFHMRKCLCALLAFSLIVCLASPAMALKRGDLLTVNADFTRLREKPASGSDVLDKLAKGRQVKFIKDYRGWYKVELKDGTIGYMYKSNLVANSPTAKIGKLYCSRSKNKRITIYSKADKNSKIKGSVKPTTTLLLVEKKGNWGLVRLLNNGNFGYVKTNQLKRITSTSKETEH